MLAVICLGAMADRAWKIIPHHQSAQLVEIPEITEEIDAPEAEVPPTPEQPAPPAATPALQPPDILRQVQIEGPVDAIVGDPVHLRVRATGGTPINYAWTISPNVDGLFVLDDGSSAIFTNRTPQPYTVYVSAVDEYGNLEQDTFDFKLVAQKDTLTLRNLAEADPDPTIPELMDYYVTLVNSPTKESEVIVISQSFRQTANLLRTGALNAGDDIFSNMLSGLELTMGPQTLQRWEAFFNPTQRLLAQYKSKGYLDTRDAWVNTLENLAVVLETRGDRN